MMPSWISRDAGLIIAARGMRTFSQSYVAILIFFYLKELGFGIGHVGIFLSVGVAGVAFFAFIVGLISGRIGRRRLMVAFTLVSAASAVILIFIGDYWALLLLAFFGFWLFRGYRLPSTVTAETVLEAGLELPEAPVDG